MENHVKIATIQIRNQPFLKQAIAVTSMEIMTKICKLIQASCGSLKPFVETLNLVTLVDWVVGGWVCSGWVFLNILSPDFPSLQNVFP